MNAKNHTRANKDGPWCWQNKRTLRLIRDSFDASNNVTSALAVYLALTEIASDEEGNILSRRIGEIANRAGVSYRTAAKILDRLETLKIIAVRRNKMEGTNERAPSTFSLLRLRNQYRTSRNGHRQRPLPKFREESPEENLEQTQNFEDEADDDTPF